MMTYVQCIRRKNLGAAHRKSILTKCRQEFSEHGNPLSALLNKDETQISSRREIESMKEKFYTNLLHLSAPAVSPGVSAGEVLPLNHFLEARAGIKNIKRTTASGSDYFSAVLQEDIRYVSYSHRKLDPLKPANLRAVYELACCPS